MELKYLDSGYFLNVLWYILRDLLISHSKCCEPRKQSLNYTGNGTNHFDYPKIGNKPMFTVQKYECTEYKCSSTYRMSERVSE